MKTKIYFFLFMLLVGITILCVVINLEKKYRNYFYLPYNKYIEKDCSEKLTLHFDDKNKYSSKGKEICISNTYFTSLKNYKTIEKKLNKLVSNYEKKLCNNNNYTYYDKKNNLTILNYDIKKDKIYSKYYISFVKDKISDYNCKIIEDYTKVELGYDKSYYPKEEKYKVTDKQYVYSNIDGKVYNVYTDCPYCLTVKNGVGTMTTLVDMLNGNFIKMNTVLEGLDYSVSNNNTKKETNSKGTLYKNDKFNLFLCNNKHIYIGEKLEPSKIKNLCSK